MECYKILNSFYYCHLSDGSCIQVCKLDDWHSPYTIEFRKEWEVPPHTELVKIDNSEFLLAYSQVQNELNKIVGL